MHKNRKQGIDKFGKELVISVKSERCACGTHYTHPNGRHEFRPRNAPCSWCGENTVTVEKEGSWKARYCGCGMNVYTANGDKIFFPKDVMVHIPASVERLDERIKEEITLKRKA
jgi:hypothetical protein